MMFQYNRGIPLEWKQRSPLCSRIATGISWSSLGGLKGVKPLFKLLKDGKMNSGCSNKTWQLNKGFSINTMKKNKGEKR